MKILPLALVLARLLGVAGGIGATLRAAEPAPPRHRILFFTKSSAFEHGVISWKNGRPSQAERVLQQLGLAQGWEFEFSKDGSRFSPDYLARFDAVFFFTSGNLLTPGTDGEPAMTAAGKQALINWVRAGHGFIGAHSASDTFHTDNEDRKGPERYVNHGERADAFVHLLGGEFIKHGAQQRVTNRVVDRSFPGFAHAGDAFALHEEWYSLKDFAPDLHVLTVIDAPAMKGVEYQRPPYPTTWARREGRGRVWYTAMGHRPEVWTDPLFQEILIGGIQWALGEVAGPTRPNLRTAAPMARINPPYPAPAPGAAPVGR